MVDRPRRLAAVIAGGASSRFGSDKALAPLDGRPLIAHVIDRLRPQADALVVVGRAHPGQPTVGDRPGPGLGPLAGLNAALAYAAAHGFETVLTAGCDLPGLPGDLVARLGDAPAVASGQPLVGVWPAALAGDLDAYLAATASRSMRGWAAAAGARTVDLGTFANINTVGDLQAFVASYGTGAARRL